MVTGGYGGGYLDSTELYIPGEDQWTISGPLPSRRSYLRGATISNKVLVTGKFELFTERFLKFYIIGGFFGDNSGNYNYDDILLFDVEAGNSGEWRHIGAMNVKRSDHGVSPININEIKDYCF